MNEFSKVVNGVVKFYFDLANKTYPKLSSFAIVTDENFSTFSIAINVNEFFIDVGNQIISDEDYWNTAEWTDESFSSHCKNDDKTLIFKFLENKEFKESEVLDVFHKSLLSLRTKENEKVCIFLHITDFIYLEYLYNIVKDLNGSVIAENYKKYFISEPT